MYTACVYFDLHTELANLKAWAPTATYPFHIHFCPFSDLTQAWAQHTTVKTRPDLRQHFVMQLLGKYLRTRTAQT